MTDGFTLIEKLHRHLRDGEPMTDAERKLAAGALGSAINRTVDSLDEAFDWNRKPSKSGALSARNAYLRQAVLEHFSHLRSREAKADALEQALARYFSDSWPRYQDRDNCPHPVDSLPWCLWNALNALSYVPRSPLKYRQLCTIIGS